MTSDQDMIVSEALAACPHCGSNRFARVKLYPWEKDGESDLVWGYHVICDASGLDGSPRGCGAASGWAETPKEAAESWNRRPSPSISEGEVETAVDRHIQSLRYHVDLIGPRNYADQRLYISREIERLADALAASKARATTDVEVKALEWGRDHIRDEWYGNPMHNTGPGYLVLADGRWRLRDGACIWVLDQVGDVKAAKAAAQLDYATRIRSALVGGTP